MDVGVDVGGTFTDFVGFRGREVVTAKVPSTSDPSRAVVQGMRELGADGVAHGTTIATNAILERKGARTVFVTTAGFEDLLVIGRQDRPNLYDFHVTRASPAVDSGMCLGARERVDARGRPLRPLTEREARRIATEVRSRNAESVAVCLLFSFLRPSHERMIRKALGDLPVSVSHEVLPEFREYERASTTVLDAYLQPLLARYLADLRAAIRKDFFMMKSGGGVAVQSAVARRPVDLVLSGPAGGVAAAAALSRGSHGKNFVTFDMGGTSADFSSLPEGEPTWTTDAVIDTFPIAIPVVDIESVGAGGGSLAWIDAGGALRVGPESAGANPGPMAYGAGGSQVTVTDADLVGGFLGPSLLGGRLPLDKSLSTNGVEALASTLHLSRDEASLGVQRVVVASVGKGLRLVLGGGGRGRFDSSVDLRFKGQSYEINVPIRGDLRRAFHRAHRLRYGYASRTEAIEVVTVRLVVRMPRPIRQPRPPPPSESRPQVRRVLFDDGWHDAPVHERARLGVGSEIDGPAIVAEDHATTVVPPGGHLTVDRFGLLEVEVPR